MDFPEAASWLAVVTDDVQVAAVFTDEGTARATLLSSRWIGPAARATPRIVVPANPAPYTVIDLGLITVIVNDPSNPYWFTEGEVAKATAEKLGYTKSYLMINAFLYGIYNQTMALPHLDDPEIVAYRHRWFAAALAPYLPADKKPAGLTQSSAHRIANQVKTVVAESFAHLLDLLYADGPTRPAIWDGLHRRRVGPSDHRRRHAGGQSVQPDRDGAQSFRHESPPVFLRHHQSPRRHRCEG